MGGFVSTLSAKNLSNEPASAEKNNNVERETVIIPVDQSRQAETAFEWYMKHVHKPQNYVYVVHCQELEHPSGENYPDYAFTPEEYSELFDKARNSGKNIMEKYNGKLKERGIRGEVKADVGRAGEVVIRAADRHNASMIVMGSRGYGIVRRTILGSVSEYVLHHTKVPVTIIPKETQHWFF